MRMSDARLLFSSDLGDGSTTCLTAIAWTDARDENWVLLSGSTFDAVMRSDEWEALRKAFEVPAQAQ